MADKNTRSPQPSRNLDGVSRKPSVSGSRARAGKRKKSVTITSIMRAPVSTSPTEEQDDLQNSLQNIQDVPGGAYPSSEEEEEDSQAGEQPSGRKDKSDAGLEQERARDLSRDKKQDKGEALKAQAKAKIKQAGKVAKDAAKKAVKKAMKKAIMQAIRFIVALIGPYIGIGILILVLVILLGIVVNEYGCKIIPWVCT